MDGDWSTPDLVAVVRLAVRNLEPIEGSNRTFTAFRAIADYVAHRRNSNSQSGSRRATSLITTIWVTTSIMVRAQTAVTHPRFIAMVRELICERIDEDRARLTIGALRPRPDLCPVDCCPTPKRPPAT